MFAEAAFIARLMAMRSRPEFNCNFCAIGNPRARLCLFLTRISKFDSKTIYSVTLFINGTGCRWVSNCSKNNLETLICFLFKLVK